MKLLKFLLSDAEQKHFEKFQEQHFEKFQKQHRSSMTVTGKGTISMSLNDAYEVSEEIKNKKGE